MWDVFVFESNHVKGVGLLAGSSLVAKAASELAKLKGNFFSNFCHISVRGQNPPPITLKFYHFPLSTPLPTMFGPKYLESSNVSHGPLPLLGCHE